MMCALKKLNVVQKVAIILVWLFKEIIFWPELLEKEKEKKDRNSYV